ncbi:hypothetical protein HK101_007159 [Irineochytrium annulatum]|nr:hypothetical protein HK101_007159 [Irineochytrium annulatum]
MNWSSALRLAVAFALGTVVVAVLGTLDGVGVAAAEAGKTHSGRAGAFREGVSRISRSLQLAATIPSSTSYVQVLQQYGVATDLRFAGAVIVPKTLAVIDELQMRPILNSLLQQNVLPADPNGIYLFVAGLDSLPGSVTTQDQAYCTLTDPLVSQATALGPPVGWYNALMGEVADICNSMGGYAINPVTGVRWAVQKLWSNSLLTCVDTPLNNDAAVVYNGTR